MQERKQRLRFVISEFFITLGPPRTFPGPLPSGSPPRIPVQNPTSGGCCSLVPLPAMFLVEVLARSIPCGYLWIKRLIPVSVLLVCPACPQNHTYLSYNAPTILLFPPFLLLCAFFPFLKLLFASNIFFFHFAGLAFSAYGIFWNLLFLSGIK